MNASHFEIRPVRKSIDLPTLAVIVVMCLGFPLIGYAQYSGLIHPLLGVLFGIFFMNLSFCAWHESSHGNFSKNKRINDWAGIIASFFSMYPGYYARRREHLIHHKWEGVEGKDPVYPRIQKTNLFTFAWRLFEVDYIQKLKIDIPENFFPITKKQKVIDNTSNFLSLIVILSSFIFWGMDGFLSVLCCWVIPRFIIIVIHAYYICYFPHYIGKGGYKKYRVNPGNFPIRFLTVEQNFHGIHHRWPFIPWHQYRLVYKNCKKEMKDNDIEIIHSIPS